MRVRATVALRMYGSECGCRFETSCLRQKVMGRNESELYYMFSKFSVPVPHLSICHGLNCEHVLVLNDLSDSNPGIGYRMGVRMITT